MTRTLRYEPDDPDAPLVRATIHTHLLAATKAIGEALNGASGCSVVLSSIGHWFMELAELDRNDAANYFRALATLADTTSTKEQKETAERMRRVLFSRLADLARAAEAK